jgi:alkaline phosphatase
MAHVAVKVLPSQKSYHNSPQPPTLRYKQGHIMPFSKLSRRDILALATAGAGASAFGLPRLSRAETPDQRPKRAKNILFLVTDGMPVSIATMADHYQQLAHGKPSYWMSLLDRPDVRSALQDTRSLSSLVTDSAAAAGAWGSGRLQWNGQINMFPDGTRLRTLYAILQEQGMKTGLVTTTTLTHATPSGFAIQMDRRDKEADIARQHLVANVDVLLGGGNRFFAGDQRPDKRDLYRLFAAQGYQILRTRDELMACKPGKALGVFAHSHLPYTVDRRNDPKLAAATPTLAEMTRKALELLKGSKEGFILQVEGGRVDHGCHANDLPAAVFDQIEFEDAMQVAVEFALQDRETLVIVTADHACGGPALNGAGPEYFDATAGLLTLSKMKSSWTNLLVELRLDPKPDSIRDRVKDKLGLELKAAEAEAIAQTLAGRSPFAVSSFYASPSATLGAILGNHTKVTYTSNNHTNDHVLLTALGPGSEQIHGLVQNTSLFDMMLAVRGLRWENPKMSFEEARRHYKDDGLDAVEEHA